MSEVAVKVAVPVGIDQSFTGIVEIWAEDAETLSSALDDLGVGVEDISLRATFGLSWKDVEMLGFDVTPSFLNTQFDYWEENWEVNKTRKGELI